MEVARSTAYMMGEIFSASESWAFGAGGVGWAAPSLGDAGLADRKHQPRAADAQTRLEQRQRPASPG